MDNHDYLDLNQSTHLKIDGVADRAKTFDYDDILRKIMDSAETRRSTVPWVLANFPLWQVRELLDYAAAYLGYEKAFSVAVSLLNETISVDVKMPISEALGRRFVEAIEKSSCGGGTPCPLMETIKRANTEARG